MKKVLLAFFGFTLLLACNTSHQQGEINLNNGKKWKVNAEMKPHIENGNAILLAFISNEEKDYHALAANLKAQNTALIQSCTMKGESHNELHKWLHPHMKLVEKLSESSNSKEAEAVISQLDESFKTYQNYFD